MKTTGLNALVGARLALVMAYAVSAGKGREGGVEYTVFVMCATHMMYAVTL